MIKKFHSNDARLRRHQRMRRHLEGTTVRPRLSVYRSGSQIYAQVIDDTTGRTMVAASSLDASLRGFKAAPAASSAQSRKAAEEQPVEVAAEAAPAGQGKGAKAEKQQQPKAKAPAKGAQQQKGGKPAPQAKTLLPTAVKGERKTPVEALAPIANNQKVALAREVGKLVAQRAKEQGVSRVVFDRGGFAYHGRVAALAEGAREVGLEF